MDDEALVLYLLRKTFHKVQTSTQKTEFSINLPVKILYLKKRKKTRKLFMFLAAVMLTNPPINRSVCLLRRSSEWLYMAETTFTDRQWYENFRVCRETFQYIVSEVIHEIRRQDTMFRKAFCPNTKVAILLYYLGAIAEYRTIANLFGVSKYFVSLCIKEVALAIVRKLKTSPLFVPKGEEITTVKTLN